MAQAQKTILIVDDELFFRQTLKDALGNTYRTIETGNGDEAFAIAFERHPDLILLDIELPGANGIDICWRLKHEEATRRIPIILLTTHLKKEHLIRGLKAGADDYITKPACLPEVIARVDAHLRSRDYYADLEHQDLLFLLELSENMFATRNPMTILQMIIDRVAEVIDVGRCSFIGLDSHGELVVKASNDLEAGEEIRLDLKKYPEINKALETKRPVFVNNVGQDPLMEKVLGTANMLADNSIVVIPMIKKESVIGTFFLRVASMSSRVVSQRVYKLCQLVASLSANALENAILFESLKTAQEHFEEMSIRDGLTRLYNHRHFYTRLEHEYSRAARYATPLSLVFFDIDNFKQINDSFGHANGDSVLRKIGHLIRNIVRQSDVGARYGGDEFVIILPNTNQENASEMANRLRDAIRAERFDCLDGAHVTISMGVVTCEPDETTAVENVVQLADDAMYQSKMSGKDRVTCHPCSKGAVPK